MQKIKKKDSKKRFTYISSSSKNLYETYGITQKEAMKGIMFIDKKGRLFHKASAIQEIYARLHSSHIFAWGRKIPLLKQCIDFGYGFVAKHRYKLYGRCNGRCQL